MLAWLLLVASSATAAELRGKVIRLSDGDTLVILDADKQQYKIRLLGIDAPEKGQAFGGKAHTALRDKLIQKDVRVRWASKDRYGRYLGDVTLDDRNINTEMVREGYAWHYKQYSADKALADAEKQSREAKSGLWADDKPVPPWEWRRGEAERRKAAKK